MPDYLKLVEAKEKDEGDLHTRQDLDVKTRDLARYVLSDDLRQPLSGIINVTLNRPAVFYANIFAALNNAFEQIVVESPTQGFDTHYVENFRKAGFNAANTRLRKQGRFRIEPFIDEQSCIRGRAANRVLFRMVKGKLVADIANWDTRYLSYEMDGDGVAWGGLNEKRSMDLIKSQYPKEIIRYKIDTSKKDAKVLDVWHREGNEVWIGGQKVVEQEHKFGFTPIVIEVVTLGSMLSDEDSLVRRGESIFFLIRSIIPELNRLGSIVATQTQLTVKPPIQTENPQGKTAEPPDYDVMDQGSSSSADQGMLTHVLEMGDIGRAATLLSNMLEAALQEGSLSSSDLGVPGSPPQSGVSLLIRQEGRNQVFLPRLDVKANMKLGIGDMFTTQVEQIGGTVELDNQTFDTSKLGGQYQVKHVYSVKSKATDAGLATLVAAYGDLIPKKSKLEILGREDPEGEEDQLNWELVGMKYPIVQMRRDVISLLKLKEEEEASLVIDSAGVELEKLLAGELEEPKPEERKEPTQVTSLFGGQSSKGQPVEEV